MVHTEWGQVLDGRGQIIKGLIALFAASPTHAALMNSPTLSRRITEDVMVSQGTATRRPTSGNE
jgi:hypothetical protein